MTFNINLSEYYKRRKTLLISPYWQVKKNSVLFVFPFKVIRIIRNPGKFRLGNPESRKFVVVESGILGFGIRNPSCSDKVSGIVYLEYGIYSVESRI